MQAVDEKLFLEFVDTLNTELSEAGATLRVERRWRSEQDITLIDPAGRILGPIPDHVDAATILAFENILRGTAQA